MIDEDQIHAVLGAAVVLMAACGVQFYDGFSAHVGGAVSAGSAPSHVKKRALSGSANRILDS
jgi:hypothetical protein